MMLVRVVSSSIRMSKNEVKAMAEAHSGEKLTEWEMRKLPGTEGPSQFEEIFEGEKTL